MPPTQSQRSSFLALILLFASLAGAQPLTAPKDDPVWRELVTSYFLTYTKRDVEGVLALWSAQSPELAAQRQAVGEMFAEYEKIELKDVAVRKVTMDGDKANVRAVVELNVTKKGESASRVRKINRVLQFMKETAAWRVWSESAPERDLAGLIAAAKTGEERQRLLTEDYELLTVRLREELIVQAETLRTKGSFEEALAVLEIAQRIAEQLRDQEGVAEALRGVGAIHARRGNLAQAVESYRKGLEIFEALKDKSGAARALVSIGNVYKAQGNTPQAIESYEKGRALSEAMGDKDVLARSLNNLAVIFQAQGSYTQALEYSRKSLEIFQAMGTRIGVAATLGNIGNSYQALGDYEQAVDYYEKSLTLKRELGDKAEIALTLLNLGNVYLTQGSYSQALQNYQQCLEISESVRDRIGIARALGSIGLVNKLQGNYAQALQYYQKSLEMSEALGNKVATSITLGNIGGVHADQGNYAQAVEYYQKSLALKEAAGDKPGIASMLGNLGVVNQSQGNHAQALEYARKSLQMYEALGDKSGISRLLINIGVVHHSQGDLTQALENYNKSLALKEALGEKDSIAGTLSNIGKLYQQQGNYAKALDFAGRASALARETGSLDIVWQSQLVAGRANAALNLPGPARQALQNSIEAIETIRARVAGAEQDSQRFFENKLSPYFAMAELLVRQNNVGEAFTYAERAKSRVLLDVLRNGRVNITKAMTTEEQEQERQLTGKLVSLNGQIHREGARSQPEQSRLAELKAELQRARLDYEALQTRLYATHPELKVKRGEAPPLKLAEAAVLLPDQGSALLEYMVTDDETYLFVLTRSGAGRDAPASVQVFPLKIKAKELGEQAANFRRQLAERDLLYRKTAVELYELLLGPARSLLKGKRLLTIVPDGMLWEMPFQALQPVPGRHLIEDSAIAYAPSLTVLREMNKARGKTPVAADTWSLLAVGNPLLGTQSTERFKQRVMGGGLASLPEAEEQVRELQRLYGAAHSTIYVGPDAREDRVKQDAGKYRILHLATHGIFDDAAPMYSQVLLANEPGSTREDGFLEAWEIMNLDLHAELVVLSACETARGRVGAGEGVIGLSWAIFVAGSPSTVVSQWKVDAASTTALMLEFHRNLRATKSKARALQQATLKTLQDKRYRHPFYWAPFVLIGNAN